MSHCISSPGSITRALRMPATLSSAERRACRTAGPLHRPSAPSASPMGSERDCVGSMVLYGVHLIPECWMFTDNNGSALFSFQTLNQGHYNVALLTDAFLRPSSSGFSLDAWFSEAQKSEPQISFTINSAFRSPKKNANLKPIAGATNSRHLYGDAADVDTGDVDARYDRLIQAARDLNMWTEPDNGPCKKACAHADLRPATWTPRTLKNMAPYRSGTWDSRW